MNKKGREYFPLTFEMKQLLCLRLLLFNRRLVFFSKLRQKIVIDKLFPVFEHIIFIGSIDAYLDEKAIFVEQIDVSTFIFKIEFPYAHFIIFTNAFCIGFQRFFFES